MITDYFIYKTFKYWLGYIKYKDYIFKSFGYLNTLLKKKIYSILILKIIKYNIYKKNYYNYSYI